jgi:UDP-N-acetylmuramate--alanine ligase
VHNVKNALAAAAAAHLCGVDASAILGGLSCFGGAARRMEYRGEWRGVRLYDDYAHHPDEIAAALSTARLLLGGAGRLFAVFQSHTYSRTAAFFDPITGALRLSDRVFVADIYPARETETLGMSGALLADSVGEKAAYVGDIPAIAEALKSELRPGDLLLVMGAGDIDRIFAEFA